MNKILFLLFIILFQMHGVCQDNLSSKLAKYDQWEEKATDEEKINALEKIYQQTFAQKDDSIRKVCFVRLKKIYRKTHNTDALSHLFENEIDALHESSDSITIAKLQVSLGYWCSQNGDVLNAIEHIKKAYLLGSFPDDPELTDFYFKYVLLNQSVNYARIADYENATNLLKEALTYYIQHDLTKNIMKSYNNLGEYYYLMEDYDESLVYYTKTLDLDPSKSYPLLVATAYNGLSKLSYIAKDYDKTLQQNQSALNLASNSDRKKAWELQIEIYNLNAKTYAELEQQDKQLQNWEKAIEIAEKLYKNGKHRRLAHLYNSIASAELDQGKTNSAAKYYHQALMSLPDDLIDTQFLVTYNGLIKVLYNDGNITTPHQRDSLIQIVDDAIVTYRRLRKYYRSDESRYNLADYANSFINIGIETCYVSYAASKDEKFIKKALLYSEYAKAAALEDALQNNLKQDTDVQNESQRIALHQLKTTYTHDLSVAQAANDTLAAPRIREKLRSVQVKIEMLSPTTPLLKDGLQNDIELSVTTIQDFNIRNQSATIEYFMGSQSIFRFVLDGESVSMDRITTSSELKSNISLLLQSFSFKNRHQFNNQVAHYVYQQIWPQKKIILKNVIIIPDGTLSLLPFDALVDDQNQYLIDTFNISYSSSMKSLLMTEGKKANITGGILCVAPIFKGNEALYLNESQSEIDQISTVCQTQTLLNEEASVTNFLQQRSNQKVLHLCTHASFDKQLKSAYIRFFDKKIYLPEIYNQPYDNQLVVLSACETGLGKVQNNEGVLSIARAFNYSGVPSVISSLWSINEKSTSHIFSDFYNNLSQDQKVSYSLSQAKRQYLLDDQISSSYKTPYYWAGFVLWGNNNTVKLPKPKSLPHSFWLFFLLLPITILFFYKRK